jgi:AraC-like DNA-binding protein
VLTIYEQIQRSVDLIEANLSEGVTTEAAARSASMSLRSFHRYFPALTGYRFGEYARKRRLSEAVDDLMTTEASVLEIALQSGYESHEAFTRAFKKEFGVPPLRFRSNGASAVRTRRIDLVGEVKMGVLTRSLEDMTVACFDGFKPDPEYTAQRMMEAWMERHPDAVGSHRIFGHNIDAEGQLAHEPDNYGYQLELTVPEAALPLGDGAHPGKIGAGLFIVTGIEGSFQEDPTGAWITDGWRRLQEMMNRNGLQIHPSCRWFEEWLEPVEPGNSRLDLYLEIS